MRAFIWDSVVLLGIGLSATAANAESYGPTPDEDSGDACCSGCEACLQSCCPTWTVGADAIFLNRRPMDFSFLGGLADTNQFSFEPGWQIDLVHSLKDDRELEIRHFTVDDWSAGASYSDFFFSGFVDYTSKLYSSEANLRWSRPTVTWLVGFRWIELYENWDAGTVGFGFNTLVDGRIFNHMYGFQMGADVHAYERGPMRVDADFKVGVLANHVNRNTAGNFNGIPFGSQDRINHTSFLGEIGVTASYQLGQHVAVRAGYQLLWLDGVAMGPANFIPGQNSVASTWFSHGGTAGLEVVW